MRQSAEKAVAEGGDKGPGSMGGDRGDKKPPQHDVDEPGEGMRPSLASWQAKEGKVQLSPIEIQAYEKELQEVTYRIPSSRACAREQRERALVLDPSVALGHNPLPSLLLPGVVTAGRAAGVRAP